ncbi:hypothetical protein QYF61_026399 [Mycteria americana]|uniref:Uncharacterized protein n=1 Tax=Mycteria americana TaxID=33587 RepID=A0AAN7N137_MYCAM|nr:hypothetical protein QYF61_026399 [Mycteria americana]
MGGSTSLSSSLGIFPPWGSEHPFPPCMPSASMGLVKLAKRWTGERVERFPKGHPCLPHPLALATAPSGFLNPTTIAEPANQAVGEIVSINSKYTVVG